MNLRIYLRLLRPVRSLLVVALFLEAAYLWAYLVFHVDGATARFLAFSTALPLLLGIVIAGAAHEPMHRAFFLLLPDGPQRLCKATLLAVAVFACAVTSAVAYVEPSVPPFATLGLAAGLIALPCIDRHQHLGGTAGFRGAFWGWIIFSLTAGGLLRPAMVVAPWAFLLGGFALTAASLTWGFSRRHLRQRAETPYLSFQSDLFSYRLHPRLMARQREEVALYRSRRAKKNPLVGRNWPVRSVGSSSLAWMRVFWHAFAGRHRHGNFFTAQLSLVTPVIIGGLIFPFAPEFLQGHFNLVSDYWQSLAALASPEVISAKSPMAFGGWFILGGLMQAGAAAVFLLMMPPLRLTYPISRERLARVVFGLSLVQLGVALVLPGAAISLISLLGQIVSGHLLPGYGLPSIVALDLVLAIGLPLLACAGSCSCPAERIIWGAPVAFAIFVAVLARSIWMPYVLTVPGSAVMMLIASANVGLLWLCLRSNYRTCDLISGPGLLNTRP